MEHSSESWSIIDTTSVNDENTENGRFLERGDHDRTLFNIHTIATITSSQVRRVMLYIRCGNFPAPYFLLYFTCSELCKINLTFLCINWNVTRNGRGSSTLASPFDMQCLSSFPTVMNFHYTSTDMM